jgi:TP901 family phage tail tape measure protein
LADLNIALILKLIDQVTAPARRVSDALGDVERQTDQTNDASRRAGSASERAAAAHQKRAGELRGQALGVAAWGASLVGALQPAINFQDEMGRVGATLDANDAQLAALTAKARELGISTSWSAREAAGGMEELASAGFNTTQIIDAMAPTLSLARAGKIGIAEAADIAGVALNSFGLEAANMGDVADQMVAAATSASLEVNEIGESMKYVGAGARSAGVELPKVLAMFAALSKGGIKGSQAGTSLKAIFSGMSAPSKAGQDAMERIGLKTKDANGNLRDMFTLITELNEKTAGLGSADKIGVVNAIVGTEAQSGLLTLMQTAKDGDLQQFLSDVEKSQGTAARIAAQIDKSSKNQIGNFMGAVEDVAIAGGTALLPVLTDLLKQLAPFLEATSKWVDANPQLVAGIGKVVLGILALKIGVLGIGFAFNTVLGAVAIIGKLNLAFTAARGFAMGFFGVFRMSVALAGLGPTLLALATGPLGIFIAVVAGVAALGYLVIKNWGVVKPFLVGLWNGIVSVVQGAWTILKALFMTFSPLGVIVKNWGPISKVLGGIWDKVTGGISGFVDGASAKIKELTPDWLIDAWDKVKGVFGGIWGEIEKRAAGKGGNVWDPLFAPLSAFDWTKFIDTLDWRLFVPIIGWAMMAGDLDWATLVKSIDWKMFVPGIGWLAIAGGLAWDFIIKPLGWDRFIPKVNWSSFMPASWASILPKWSWSSIIPAMPAMRMAVTAVPTSAPAVAAASAGAGLLTRRASGGSFGRGPLLVGELGPELAYANRAGYIANHNQLAAMAELGERIRGSRAGGGSGSAPLMRTSAGGASGPRPSLSFGDIHVHAAPGQSPQEIARMVMAEIERVFGQNQRGALHDFVEA